QFERLVGIDDPPRLGEQRRRLEIGREDLTVAVEQVRARGGDGVGGAAVARGTSLWRDGIEHEARGDDAIDDGKAYHREPETRPGLASTIDIVAVQQRLEHATMPRRRRRLGGG